MYRPKEDKNAYGTSEEQMSAIKSTDRFRPARDFQGVDREKTNHPRDGPVQFEEVKESDPFGLDKFHGDLGK